MQLTPIRQMGDENRDPRNGRRQENSNRFRNKRRRPENVGDDGLQVLSEVESTTIP